MTNELFVAIVQAFLLIISALVTSKLVPLIRSKYTSEQLARFTFYVEQAVRCAEQLFTEEQMKEKKEYVVNYCLTLINGGFNISLNEDDINIIIEGVVNNIKHDAEYGIVEVNE